MVGRVGPGRARADRGAPVPQRRRSAAGRRCTGTSSALYRGRPGRAARGRARRRPARRHRHRLAGRSTTGCSTRTGRCSATRALPGRPHRRRRRDGARARSTRRRAVRGHRAAVPAVQHALPARAADGTTGWTAAAALLLIPDLLAYWLTGERGRGATNASTTGLLDARTGELGRRARRARSGLPAGLLPAARRSRASRSARCRRTVPDELGLDRAVPVTAVGSHDTASAVVGVPAGDRPVRLHLLRHLVAGRRRARRAGAHRGQPAAPTSPTSAASTAPIRYLRNVMGLWLLQESLRTWSLRGDRPTCTDAARAAAAAPAVRSAASTPTTRRSCRPATCRPGSPRPAASTGQPVPADPGRDRPLHPRQPRRRPTPRGPSTAERLSGRAVDVVHIVGGGAQNALLCQLTADACGLPVVAGPVEATALGNVLVQARTLGAVCRGPRRAARAGPRTPRA